MESAREAGFNVSGSDISAEGIDITDWVSINKYLDSATPWAVINCAAITNVEACEDKQGYMLAKEVNGKGPGLLAKYCKERGCHFVHFSSETVFGLNKKSGYKEDFQKFTPLTNYARSKLLGEKNLIKMADGLKGSDFNFQATKFYLIRTSWLFGPGASNFIAKILELASKQPEIQVVTDESACPTYTKDLADTAMTLLKSLPPGGIYHITGKGSCSRFEFAKEIIRLANLQAEVIPTTLAAFNRKVKIANYGELLNTKLPAQRSWQKMLRDFMNTYQP